MTDPSIDRTRSAPPPADWLAVVQTSVAAMRFGTIQITVHEGRVTQVEATEKTRFISEPAKRRP